MWSETSIQMFPTTFLYTPFNTTTNTLKSRKMVVSPCAKINLGLNVVSLRHDGYHDIETVFFPIPLYDRLEITVETVENIGAKGYQLVVDGREIDCKSDDNLVVKAYNLLASDFDLPPVRISLHKVIPMQAGLGGGSSDAAYTLTLLNKLCELNLDNDFLADRAARLGADCPFFITSQPAFATGIGDVLTPLNQDKLLRGYNLVIVKPDVAVSTKEAYSMIKPRRPKQCCRDILTMPITEWRNHLCNDFEQSVFATHPILAEIKHSLYDIGAIYVQMSGSGSSIFAIFNDSPKGLNDTFRNCFIHSMQL